VGARDALVAEGTCRGGGSFLLLGCRNDGLEVIFAAFVASIPVRGLRDLLCLVYRRLLNVGAVHHGGLVCFPATSALAQGSSVERCWDCYADARGRLMGVCSKHTRQFRSVQRAARSIWPGGCCALLNSIAVARFVGLSWSRGPLGVRAGAWRGVCCQPQVRSDGGGMLRLSNTSAGLQIRRNLNAPTGVGWDGMQV
jgi:hypothetical protein